jgi:hypothetical protein
MTGKGLLGINYVEACYEQLMRLRCTLCGLRVGFSQLYAMAIRLGLSDCREYVGRCNAEH